MDIPPVLSTFIVHLLNNPDWRNEDSEFCKLFGLLDSETIQWLSFIFYLGQNQFIDPVLGAANPYYGMRLYHLFCDTFDFPGPNMIRFEEDIVFDLFERFVNLYENPDVVTRLDGYREVLDSFMWDFNFVRRLNFQRLMRIYERAYNEENVFAMYQGGTHVLFPIFRNEVPEPTFETEHAFLILPNIPMPPLRADSATANPFDRDLIPDTFVPRIVFSDIHLLRRSFRPMK